MVITNHLARYARVPSFAGGEFVMTLNLNIPSCEGVVFENAEGYL